MTVCVAAISQSSTGTGLMITGASDRMLTAGDIEFEPEQSKIQPLTNSIALMLAGDSAHTTGNRAKCFRGHNGKDKI